jgi:transposase
VEDEAELSTFPTLTRMWMQRGKQRRINAPGVSPVKRHEVAAVDWRTGDIVRIRNDKRNADAFCRLVRKCLQRSGKRKRRVIMVLDRARFHRPEKSKLVQLLVTKFDRRLTLRYLPSYSPDCMPMELLWNDWRDNVTHNHNRSSIMDLERDSTRYFRRRSSDKIAVLRTINSPFQNHI